MKFQFIVGGTKSQEEILDLQIWRQQIFLYAIQSSHSSEYEDNWFLGCAALKSGR
jgi:hypothetical protein